MGAALPASTRVVVLRGEGTVFSAGIDLRAFTPDGIDGDRILADIGATDDAGRFSFSGSMKNVGGVVSVAIDRYIYLSDHPYFDQDGFLLDQDRYAYHRYDLDPAARVTARLSCRSSSKSAQKSR